MGTPDEKDFEILRQIRRRRGVGEVPVPVPAVPTEPTEPDRGIMGFLGDVIRDAPKHTMLGDITAFPEVLEGAERVERLLGLPVGIAGTAALGGITGPFMPGPLEGWLPDVGRTPEATRAFIEQARRGDVDAGIEAAQDVFGAGTGFWGVPEAAGTFIPTGGPALLGTRVMGAAPGITRAATKLAPSVMGRPGVAGGVETGLTTLGKTLRVPWEAEEAVGRAIARPIGAALRGGKGLARRVLDRGVVEEVGEVVPTITDEIAENLRDLQHSQATEVSRAEVQLHGPSAKLKILAEERNRAVNAVRSLSEEFEEDYSKGVDAIDSLTEKFKEDYSKGVDTIESLHEGNLAGTLGRAETDMARVAREKDFADRLAALNEAQVVKKRDFDDDLAALNEAQVVKKRDFDDKLSVLEKVERTASEVVEAQEKSMQGPRAALGLAQYKKEVALDPDVQRRWSRDPAGRIQAEQGVAARGMYGKAYEALTGDEKRVVDTALTEYRQREGFGGTGTGREIGEEVSDAAFVGSRQPKVVRDIPINAIARDDQAGAIVSSADPGPPKAVFDSTPEQVFAGLKDVATPSEMIEMRPARLKSLLRAIDPTGLITEQRARPEEIIRTIMRRHWSAINAAEVEAKRIVQGGLKETDKGEPLLRELGLSVSRQSREVIREDAIPEIDALYKALHDRRFPVPERLRGLYNELRDLADFEEISRIDFDPNQAKARDYFYRGWRESDALKAAKRRPQIGGTPAFKQPRKDASYQEMRDAGYEPLSWNPFEQWRISRMQGIRYRQQMVLVAQLKKTGLWRPSAGATTEGVEGIIDLDGGKWRTPAIGPAFEGKVLSVADNVLDEAGLETGEQVLKEIRIGRGVVHPDVAKRLESMYGSMPEGWAEVGGVDIAKVIDWLVFIPKSAKLFGSFFQQIDFLWRSVKGTGSHVIERLAAGDIKGAARVGYKWPSSAYKIIKANLSPDYRLELKRWLGSTEELVPGRPGITPKGIMEAGLSIRDTSIFPTDIGDIARSAATDAGVMGSKKVLRYIAQLESAMRRGLFDGAYPAAQITDIINNVAPQMAREWGHLSDAQINGAIAEFINTRYSTIPPWQSVIQNRYIRAFLQRFFFSMGESEGLLRGGIGLVTGPYKGMWAKDWLGAYLVLMTTANVIHVASTQGREKHLPWERWVPVSEDNWGPLPFSYRRDFAAPNLPWKGRGAVELTIDLVGQMDTVFRLLNPVSFLNARESVPVRTLQNQIKGTDWYGADITEAGPMGLYSRTASAINDMFNPIGIGQSALNIARERIPAIAAVLPPGEERIGVGGQLTQATGLNVRAETTPAYKNRMARESGLINLDTNEPVRTWDELLPRQEDQVRQMFPGFTEELQRRTETQVGRQSESAQRRVVVQEYENDLISKVQNVSTQHLGDPMTNKSWSPKVARKAIENHEARYYDALYGILWSGEKQRFKGGVYDEDIEFDEPKENTIDHALWRYRNIYQDARNKETGELEFTGEAGTLLNKALGEFWYGLRETPRVAAEVVGNIRMIEGKYPVEMQTVKAASRYAGSLKLNIDGEIVSYFGLEDHPRVVRSVAATAGATEDQVREFLELSFPERDARASNTVLDGKIRKALEKGELLKLRGEFVKAAPVEWRWAMFDAGYSYPGSGGDNGVDARLKEQIRGGSPKPVHDYEALYWQGLIANR